MSLRLFNPVRADRPTQTQRRDGSCNGVTPAGRERSQTALRGPAALPSGGATVAPKRNAPETSPCRRDGHSKTTARPPEGDGFDGRRRGNRDPRPALAPVKTASAQLLVVDSSVGPHRSTAPPGVATLVLFQIDLVIIRPVTGPGANQSVAGSGVCRNATREVGPQRMLRETRSPERPSSADSSPGRAGGLASQAVHVFAPAARAGRSLHRTAGARAPPIPSPAVLVLVGHPFKKRVTSKACCLRHR